ncbi:ubiquinone biosynthesis protein [Novimethylophilus kurashikiensis]|uniref:Ubiquinone biosynthesis protein n=1 Tax=Novimethylophilus kurashikiensis TaxID=1825523 RepID=A0A2R5F8G5_9PROT|nr:AarF/UbiB family protein [Novimethylophilus kurashikiensis]GBG13203.1 ubiquinone biosynthesis protein [Novimethylophilus kurashikiensis]
MIRETVSVMRDFGRLREIAGIFIRYGWGDAIKRLGLSKLLGASKLLHPQAALEVMHLPPEVRVRMAIQELGPTFVKLGQVLATRPDIFPPSWIAEFAKLQDKVPPVPFEELLPQLEQALGHSPFEVFRELNQEAIAGASIAQVHAAVLQDGTPVVLKIRRPHIESLIEADLRLLSHLGRLIESEMPEVRRLHLGKIIGQFSKSLRKELDLAAEGRNTDHFHANFEANPDVVFAKIFWEYTSEKLLVMEHLPGIAGNEIEEARASGLDLKKLAALGANTLLKMVLIDGFFHADPHPGNVFYLPGNRLAVIDCGMVGRLTLERRNQIADLLASLVSKDYETLLNILIDWAGDASVDETKLEGDLEEFLFNYHDASLRQISFGRLLNDLTTVMRENHLSVPSDLAMLFKALITLEGLGRQLDPDFQIVRHLTPFVKQVIYDRYMPGTLLKRGRRSLMGALGMLTSVPRDFAKLMKEMRRGRVKIEFDLKRLDHFGHQIDHSTNRLTLGLLTSALIIGSSIVMTVKGGPTLLGLPAFGFLGFFIASVFGLWLMISIWRSSRED